MLNSFAGRLALVAVAGLSISTASAGTPPSLSGAIPGPMGKYAVKDATGNKAVGVDGRVMDRADHRGEERGDLDRHGRSAERGEHSEGDDGEHQRVERMHSCAHPEVEVPRRMMDAVETPGPTLAGRVLQAMPPVRGEIGDEDGRARARPQW